MKQNVKFVLWFLITAVLAAAVAYGAAPATSAAVVSILVLVAVLPRAFVKNWRVVIWLLFVLAAVILISPNLHPEGLYVVSVVEPSAPSVSPGDVILKINDAPVTQELLGAEYTEIAKIETSKGIKFIRANGTLGITAESVAPTNLKFGLDLKGGVRAVLEPNLSSGVDLNQIISTLESRINFYGLRESVFRPVYYNNKGFIEISIAGGSVEELRNLIESQGKFEAKIPLSLPVSGGKASLNLEKIYSINVTNNSLVVDGNVVGIGDTFTLAETAFTFNGITNGRLNATALVFTGDDIVVVFFDPQRSRIEAVDDGYRWTFGVQLSTAGAQRFAYATQNTNILSTGSLDAPIEFYLDGKLVDSLTIASNLKGKVETEIAISGPGATLEEAAKTRAQLQSILRSGALPTTVEIVQLDTISPNLGAGFLKSAAVAAVVALLGVLILVSARYRKPKLVVPMIIVSVTEIMIVVGLSVVIGWTIDLAAIAGIIASVGTGISDQIIILDRALRKEEESDDTTHQKIRKAFFVVFGTAGTVIAAMLPLLFTGFGILRGFALITIIGVLVGIFITRPAYGIIVENIKKE